MTRSQTHLSTEAIAAYADGELADGPRKRAGDHIAGCLECAYLVGIQQQMKFSLQHGSTCTVPGSLMERLGAIPFSADLADQSLDDVHLSVDEGGTFEFSVAAPAVPSDSHRSHLIPWRRVRVFKSGAAVVAIGVGLSLSPTFFGVEAKFVNGTDPGGHHSRILNVTNGLTDQPAGSTGR